MSRDLWPRNKNYTKILNLIDARDQEKEKQLAGVRESIKRFVSGLREKIDTLLREMEEQLLLE